VWRLNLNFYPDSSNLSTEFSQVFEQARGKLPKLGGRSRIIGREEERSGSDALDVGHAGERAGDGLQDGALQTRQLMRAAGQGAKFTRLEK